MKRTPRRFTLIEMLVVIGIIVVLAGILFPTIATAMKRARVAKAKSEMSSLITAMKAYEGDYDVMPSGSGADGWLDDAAYDIIIGILSQTGANKDAGNARKIKYLNVAKVGEYRDPWGQRYIIVADRDGNESLAKNLVRGLHNDGEILPRSVVIWSTGADKDSDATPDNKKNRDNVYSIETNWNKDSGHVVP